LQRSSSSTKPIASNRVSGWSILSRCWFDREKTERGRLALTSYRKVWDEKRRVFQNLPYHDWASNAADAFRYLAVGHKQNAPRFRDATPGRPCAAPQATWLGWRAKIVRLRPPSFGTKGMCLYMGTD